MDYNLYDGYVYVFCALMDYVVLRTMLLFSRVDVTLHAGGGTPGGCAAYGLTAAAQLYSEVIG